MGFVAKQAVAALDFDFGGVGVPELDGVKGVTPEPTQNQIRSMQFALRELFNLGADADAATITEKMAALSQDEIAGRDEQLAKIYADACTQQPSTEQLLALPHRIFSTFIGYLSGEFLTPTAGSSATKPALVPVRSA